MVNSLSNLETYLKYFFGYDQFRPEQRKIIEKALADQDLLVIMPTGGGKSLCFQLPALLKPGLMIVISPLIALMQDQVDALQDNGIGATYLNSSLSFLEVQEREKQIFENKIKLLYVAPERLLGDRFQDFFHRLITQIGVSAFAIDEAHCVSEWGHDFRPEYRQLSQLRQQYPQIPIFAFTATATKRVQKDIIDQLKLHKPSVHLTSFNRPNLYYEIIPKEKRSYEQLLKFIKTLKGSGIIYCMSRKMVDEISDRLQEDGIKALPYHAGMGDENRRMNQTQFIRDEVRIIVATVAFGMGINKPDVRFVIHYDLPRNLESYYQESGRAGRDNEPAKCLLFFSFGDLKKIEYIIQQKAPSEQQKSRQQLRQIVDYSEGLACRRTIVLRYFGEDFSGNCGNCDNCCYPRPLEDWTIEAQKFLSCVARCKERFGMMHIIDVLRGSRKQKIEQYQHHLLSTYGIGKDRTLDEWKQLGVFLIHQGFLDETTDGYSILKLNAYSWEILRKQRNVTLAVKSKVKEKTDTRDNPRARDAELLFESLRSLRQRIAKSQGIAPYVVFGDSSLKLMAQSKPTTLEEFAAISGVGRYKLQQYGEQFVKEICTFCQQDDDGNGSA
ncbi:MAG: DNA helicase RecQ [Snowella sp.]|nr:MAG: DNA helicase RecQ [Snowella sp.]